MDKPAGNQNFDRPDRPRFQANHASARLVPETGELRAVCWNIKFSKKIEAALAEIDGTAELREADILMLQEMDEIGVELIAGVLKYDYIYYPACTHGRTGRSFGNAILTRWPILEDSKLILPHLSPRTGEIRIATRALIGVGEHELLVYSVHTETIALGSARRQEQFQALVEDIRLQGVPKVLVGGDFNTLQAKDVRGLQSLFAGEDIDMISAGAGPTLKAGFLSFSMDHIFARGVQPVDRGAWDRTAASDHFPVWVRVSLD